MAEIEGLKIGKAIFLILKNNTNLLNIAGMNVSQIQPAPLKNQGDPSLAVTYEIDSVTPLNIKRTVRTDTAPVYIVDFTCECIAKTYFNTNNLAVRVSQALEEAVSGNYNGLKLNGITLQSANEDYNKARKYYINSLSFQARVLV